MLNKAILVGRLTKDPELRSTQSGMSVATFTVAVTRSYARQGEERQTDFINCVAFRNTADFISRFFTKGNLIAVDGTIQTRTWDDQEGKRHWVTEVIVNEAHFVEGKKDSAGQADGASPASDLPMDFGPDATDDDLPF
ncbi:MAG: single-stranded DNA-binding protein [Clostridia bacterium]|nr:single-stranded DNA-binding protein [Clostridia bacterium]